MQLETGARSSSMAGAEEHRASTTAERRARGLGWFSLGLGVAGLLAPGGVARLIGVREDERTRRLLQGIGVRELASGIGILTNPQSAAWVWSRVFGDVMDLALLAHSLESEESNRERVVGATLAIAGITMVDAMCASQLASEDGVDGDSTDRSAPGRAESRQIRLAKAVTVKRPRPEVYAFWRNFENLPRFFQHLESVEVEGKRSRWKTRLIGQSPLEWDAEIVVDRPDESIEWASTADGGMTSRGAVQFLDAPGRRGTEVRVMLEYEPKGLLGARLLKLLGQIPAEQIGNDLRRFKQMLEVGEVMHSDASIHRGMHPARPPKPAQRELPEREPRREREGHEVQP
jgi:uncharacterized membrane protein